MNIDRVINKPVLSIKEGRTLGIIVRPIIDGEHQKVIGFVVEDEYWYLETKIVLFHSIRGFGEEMITVDDESSLVPVKRIENIHPYLHSNIQPFGIKIISESGKDLGEVDSFAFNEQTGRIEEYTVRGSPFAVECRDVISLTRKMLIIKDDSLKGVSGGRIPSFSDLDLSSLFEKRQIEFLMGKRLIRDIIDDSGATVVYAGDVVTDELIKKMKKMGKFTELLMSVEAEE